MRYGEKQLAHKLGVAAGALERGNSIQVAKSLAGVTLAAMLKYGLIHEMMIPDPRGYSENEDGKKIHNGVMVRSGSLIPTRRL